MKRIFLMAFLSFQLLTLPATAQIAPDEAMNSSGKSKIVTARKMSESGTMVVPDQLGNDEQCDTYKKRIIEFEALVKTQNELIEALKYELKQCKEAKDGKKH